MLINGERALAYVVRIDDIQSIEGADRIELVKVGGWNVVAQKGIYSVGDLAVYCEVDSWIPHTIAPFLTQDGHYPKMFNEVEGQRLKTKRLKGVYSSGLLLPLSILGEIIERQNKIYINTTDSKLKNYEVSNANLYDIQSHDG